MYPAGGGFYLPLHGRYLLIREQWVDELSMKAAVWLSERVWHLNTYIIYKLTPNPVLKTSVPVLSVEPKAAQSVCVRLHLLASVALDFTWLYLLINKPRIRTWTHTDFLNDCD